MLLAASDMAKSNRISSVAGIDVSHIFAQKVVNLFHPAEYIFLVVGERPRVMKCSAWICICSVLMGLSMIDSGVSCGGGMGIA